MPSTRPDEVEGRVEQLLAAGEGPAAVTELLRAVEPRVKRFLRALLRDEMDAAEAFAVFAEAVWKALPSFRWEASLRTWVFRVAWSSARQVRRNAWRRRHERLRTGDAARVAAPTRTASAVRVERQSAKLDALRSRLSLADRSLLELRVDQELSWDDIAAVLATGGHPADADAVRKRFERLRHRLARMARAEGLLE